MSAIFNLALGPFLATSPNLHFSNGGTCDQPFLGVKPFAINGPIILLTVKLPAPVNFSAVFLTAGANGFGTLTPLTPNLGAVNK